MLSLVWARTSGDFFTALGLTKLVVFIFEASGRQIPS